MTGASVRRQEGRGREGPRRLVLGAAVLVVAGAWGGWAAWHRRLPPVPGVLVAPPAPLAATLAAAVERDAALSVPLSGSTGEVAGTDGTAVDAGGPRLTIHDVGSGQEARGHTVHAPAGPARRRPVELTQPPPNLDNVLLGIRDAPRSISTASAADRNERADTSEASGSVRHAAAWDMRAFGLEEGPPKEPPIGTRRSVRSVPAGSSDSGALRSAAGTP